MNDKTPERRPPDLQVIGWREWVGLPDLSIKLIKAKVDTGARSSSLHAFDIIPFERDGEEWVQFTVCPVQRRVEKKLQREAKVMEYRDIRSSNGTMSKRPVIETSVKLLGQMWRVELTLANRQQMGFRMLLGRQAFRGHFVVDAGRSYYGGVPKRKAPKKTE